MPSIRFLQDAGGRRIAYALHGRGPFLVCPAWWVSHLERDWEEPSFRAFFEKLGERFTVVRYDRAGVGLSDRVTGEVSLQGDLALLERLVDTLEIPRTHLLGISCGGATCVAFAARHPEPTDRLALYGTFLRGTDVGTPEVRCAMEGLVRAHWGLGSRTMTDVFVPGLDAGPAQRYVTRQRQSADAGTAAALLGLTYDLDTTSLAPRVRAPTVVVHRRGDRAIPFECGRRLAAAIPGATFVPLEGNLHPPWEGDGVHDVIVPFLAGEEQQAEQGDRADCRLDERTRALIVNGEPVGLSRLEFDLLRHLRGRHGAVVTRDELLQQVWRQEFVGSNVVDAAVRSVRRKLGPFSTSIETVKGHGYRFAGFRRG